MNQFHLPPPSHFLHVIIHSSSSVCACRIYNKLPEVTKKKEEERKRLLLETNRLRAEVFKKVKLLISHKTALNFKAYRLYQFHH